jgi:hypothetical protein
MRFATVPSSMMVGLVLLLCHGINLSNGFSLTSPTTPISLTKGSSRIPLQRQPQFMVPSSSTEEETKGVFSAEVQQEAKEALQSVGWARPLDDGEMTSEDPFVQQIDAGIQRDFGVGLDDLLNPAKVVNLERELYNLRLELATATNKKDEETGKIIEVAGLSTEECDGGGGGEEAEAIRAKISKKETDLALERRSVFRGWLKNIFVGQAVISFGVSYIMATNPKALFGGFDWFYSYNMCVQDFPVLRI